MSGKSDNDLLREAFAPTIKWLREPVFDQDGVQASSGIDDKGQEHPDPVPMSPPVGLSAAQGDPLRDALRRLMAEERATFMAAVDAEGFESEEEANDFDVPEDLYPADPNLPWEGPFEFTEAQEAAEREARKAARASSTAPVPTPPPPTNNAPAVVSAGPSVPEAAVEAPPKGVS